MPKPKAIELLPEDTPTGRAIRAFHQAVQVYYPTETSLDEALAVIESGTAFLQAAKSWWDEHAVEQRKDI